MVKFALCFLECSRQGLNETELKSVRQIKVDLRSPNTLTIALVYCHIRRWRSA